MAVLNKHKDAIPAGAVYIGRGSLWGNPYVIGKHGSRAQVCDAYAVWIKSQIQEGKITVAQLAALNGKDLVCFCKPLQCHGDFLEVAAAAAYLKQEQK